MEEYGFDQIINRRNTNSEKWDSAEEDSILPMWVADMDFRAAPCIIEALKARVEHGIFGYVKVPKEYYEATVKWFSRWHGWEIDPGHVIYTSGVVPAISAIIKALTSPGDKVIVQTPVYNCFYSSIRNNKCQLSANLLKYSTEGYSIDFDDLERLAADPQAKLMLLCNPHNPVGRVWHKDELRKIGEICLRNNVFVVSDEIHCELTYPGHDYTPYATLDESLVSNSVTCISPSKAFNIAGLQIANIVAPDDELRRRIDRAINDNEICDVNPFGVEAAIAAYNEGKPWLDALKAYLYGIYLAVRDFFKENLPQLKVLPLEGTYLVWIDCQATGMDSDEICRQLIASERLMVNPGSMYGPGGEGFIRLNIASPRAMVIDALYRMGNFFSRIS